MRWGWNQLTSMRTALILLFLLALAAIPGSIFPQQSISPIAVMDYKAENPGLDQVLEPLGMYDVYSSPWFSAIYLLLFVSLIGCITPRITKYARDLRKPPPRLPKRLDRLPANAVVATAGADGLGTAERWLKSKRYRTLATAEGVSAERGYLRELGNLVFHLSLVGVLIGLAWSSLGGFLGSIVIVEGRGFSNAITQYDDFTAGALVDTDHLEPFSVHVDRFDAQFETGSVQRGAARVFDAHMRLTQDGETSEHLVTVNTPLTTDGGTQINLLGHGYAPLVTVTDGNGDVAFTGPMVFLPQDGNFASVGVIKVPDGRPQRLAFEGVFLPTAVLDQDGPKSVFPDALDPELWINAWHGDPAEETGIPESIYTLNTAGLEPFFGDDDERLRARMKPGAGMTLPDGLGSISFDGYARWVKLQMSETPGNPLALVSLAVGTIGLCMSLFIKPRRMFVRVTDDGLAVGGLDRSDTALGLEDEVADLAAALEEESA
ncbi:MAG: cytochrome c biogenesis protein ResB [Propionibacterium sp.]|nr:cytochrome c biogenesis protein ResB [Propionibacterium sp.]